MNQVEKKLIQLFADEKYSTAISNAGIFRFPASYRFETHAHLEYEINYVNAGCCIMGAGEDYVPLKQGECIVINPFTPHCFMVDMRKTCKITQLEIAILHSGKVAEGIRFLNPQSPFTKLKDCEPLVPVLERICFYHRTQSESEFIKAQLDFEQLSLYAALSGYIERTEKAKTAEPDRLGRLVHYINENLEEELNIEELSDMFEVSSRYIRKYFLRQMGMTCTEYITMLRVGRAKELLWDPLKSVTDVALTSGFNSSQYFCRIFKKQVGLSPAQYRRMWKKTE